MKHLKRRPPRFSLFGGYWRMALEAQRDRTAKKTIECIEVKQENEKLWEIVYKQRIAIEALREGHTKDMAELTASLSKAHQQLAAAEADRDRYRDALKRTFPKEAAV